MNFEYRLTVKIIVVSANHFKNNFVSFTKLSCPLENVGGSSFILIFFFSTGLIDFCDSPQLLSVESICIFSTCGGESFNRWPLVDGWSHISFESSCATSAAAVTVVVGDDNTSIGRGASGAETFAWLYIHFGYYKNIKK